MTEREVIAAAVAGAILLGSLGDPYEFASLCLVGILALTLYRVFSMFKKPGA